MLAKSEMSSGEIIRLNLAEHIQVALTTRGSFNDSGAFGGFNLADHVGDDEPSVRKNRAALKMKLDLVQDPCWLQQTHSADVVTVGLERQNDNKNPCLLMADASFTALKDVPLAILTADCLPIVLWSDHEVSVVHAGWKGLANGIIGRAIEKFAGNVSAWIGPAIGPCHYEVDEVVRGFFTESAAFTPAAPGHYQFDLASEAQAQLWQYGVDQVSRIDICTQCDERFYSYRRDGVTGRFATLVWRSA